MVYRKVLSQYKRSSIETAGKLDLVIMCYEKVILLLTQIKEHAREKNVDKKVPKFKKVLDIINELQSSLDMEKGGEIARNLDSLYSYLTRRLIEGDIKKDLSVYDESIRILTELKEAWQTIKSQEDQNEDIYTDRDMHESHNPRLTAY